MDFKEMRLPLEMSAWMVGGPMWNTRVFTTQGGDVTRIGLWDYPLHKFDISAGMRSIPDAAKTKLFQMRARGKLYGFRVFDPHDHQVTFEEGEVVETETPGVFQLVKIYREDGDTFRRVIKKPIPGTVLVYNDGYVVGPDPVDYTTGLVTIDGADVTLVKWLGGFDIPMSFTDDWLQIGMNSSGLLNWNNAGVMELRRIDESFGEPPGLDDQMFFGASSVDPLVPPPEPPPGPPPPPPPPPAGGSGALTNGVAKALHYSDGGLQQLTYAHGAGTVHLDGGNVGVGYYFYRVSGPPDFFGGVYDGYITSAAPGDVTGLAAGTLYIQVYFAATADLQITASGTVKTFVSSELRAHMSSPAATLAWNWMIKRKDGKFFGATTHVEPIRVPTYLPGAPLVAGQTGPTVLCLPSPGFTPTDIALSGSLAQNNLDVEAVLTATGATQDTLRAGLWRAADVEIAIVNYQDLSMGADTVFMGTLGGVVGGDLTFKVEQRGLSQLLEANLDGIVGPMCRVPLGSQGIDKCNVHLDSYRRTGTIASPTFDRIFVDAARTEADNWWTKGLLTITTGPMNGWVFEVKRSLADGTIELVEEAYFGLLPGLTYSMTPGCNKLFKMPDLTYTGDCIVKFHNGLNFQGEPEVPGQIAISQYGGQTVQ